MQLNEIIDVLKQYGVHNCTRSRWSTQIYGDTSDIESITTFKLVGNQIPFVRRCVHDDAYASQILSMWKIINDRLDRTYERTLYMPSAISKSSNETGWYKDITVSYILNIRSVPCGFLGTDGWTKCEFHTSEFFNRLMNRLKTFYDMQYDLVINNERVKTYKEDYLHASFDDRTILKNEARKLVDNIFTKMSIMME